MTVSKNANALHEKQSNAAMEQFELYKTSIVTDFVDKFGASYQTVDDCFRNWYRTFEYTAEREEFLKDKTRTFLHFLPNDIKIYYSPKFFKTFAHLVTNYLGTYTCRKEEAYVTLAPGHFISRNKYVKELHAELFDNNTYVQSKLQQYQKMMDNVTRKWHQEHREYKKRCAQRQRKELVTTGKIPTAQRAWHSHDEYMVKLHQLHDIEQKLARHEQRG